LRDENQYLRICSSGKTHTIFGGGLNSTSQLGLLPRVLDFLWSHIHVESQRQDKSINYTCGCSFYEIYQERVYDLLCTSDVSSSSPLNVRENVKLGVFVEGLTEEQVSSPESARNLLTRGYCNRHTAETSMNIESSRSHSVFVLKIESTEEERTVRKYTGFSLLRCT